VNPEGIPPVHKKGKNLRRKKVFQEPKSAANQRSIQKDAEDESIERRENEQQKAKKPTPHSL